MAEADSLHKGKAGERAIAVVDCGERCWWGENEGFSEAEKGAVAVCGAAELAGAVLAVRVHGKFGGFDGWGGGWRLCDGGDGWDGEMWVCVD